MSEELARIEAGGVVLRDEWTDDRVDLIRRMYCKGASQEEFEVFVETCKRTGLSPLARQIYAIRRKSGGQEQMTIQVGIDGFRLIADRTGRYVPGREPSFTYDDKGKLATATAYVKKLVAGEWHEIGATVRWEEFAAGGNFWQSMPHQMLAKVAEVHALRRAFPADLSGIYAPEEMDQADRARTVRVDEATGEILEPPAALPAARHQSHPQRTDAPVAMVCTWPACMETLTKGQRDVSLRAYGQLLCPTHQRKAASGTPIPAPPAPVESAALDPPTAEQRERWKRIIDQARALDLDIEHCRPTPGRSRDEVEALVALAEKIVAEETTARGSAEVAA